jgi:pilus assembly protein CpaC
MRRALSTKHRARFFGLLVLLIAVVGTTIIHAAEGENVTLIVGRSTVLDTGHPIARVSLTSADIADALVTSSSELLINGKTPGTISMFVWDRAGAIRRYEVVVQRDLTRLGTQLQELFPGESIAAQNNGRAIVLSGVVSSKEVIDRAVSVAAGYVEKKDDVVPLLQIQAGRSNQVLLHVRFAEVSRNALTEVGANLALHGFKDGRWFSRSTTQQFPAPQWDKDGKLVFSDFLNLFLFDSKEGIAGVVRALQDKGLFQSLAEPNVVAESGKEASFLAGGEIPIPIAQPSNGTVALTVQYKEFGIRLNFTPIVNGNRVHLKVRPEVSTLDYANAVTLQGFRIPAFTTRRTETEIELENGQTFSIAGLMNNTLNSSLQKIPGIGDIPILGLLFKSKAAQKGQTELVVMITPEILPNGSVGVTPVLPRLIEPFMPPAKKTFDPPPPPFPMAPPARSEGAAAAPATAPAAPAQTPTATPAQAPIAAPAMPAAPSVKPGEPVPTPIDNAVKPAQSSEEIKRQVKVADEERRSAERMRKEAAELAAAQRKRDEEAAREQAKRDEKTAKEQAKRDEKAAREQLKRDSLASKKQALIDAAEKEEAAKRAAEQAKKQAENDKRQQKALDEARARLKAAEEVYQSELAKRGTRNQ